MPALAKWLFPVAVLWGSRVHAQEATPTPAAEPQLTDERLIELSQEETVEIFDERPDKPFDRDTEVRLTGEELAARGAVDLGTALALLPDVTVRDAGRGGFNLDIRGARKGAVSVLIDGVLVTDPYYGTFDVSTIPITDIVQIRMSTTPQSPIDGPGGPGGVIEVLTRDAIGGQLVVARASGDSLPSFGITGTARVALARHLALRVSASGIAGARDLELPADASIGEQRRSATGSTRLEYREGKQRLVLDGFLDDRHYISPPSDTNNSSILMIDRETSSRVSAKADVERDRLQLQGQAWVHHLKRRSRFFLDPTLTAMQAFEDLKALRVGGLALVTHPIGKDARWAASASVDRDSARVENIGAEVSKGDVTLIELAANGQYEKRTVRIDAAAGAAIPIGVGADPWPEGKLVAKWRPSFGPLELGATAARKGRVPSLRERFDLTLGNPALGPESASHGELRATYAISDRVKLEAAPFYKRTKGTVRASTDPADMGKLANLGKLTIYGIDTSARVRPHPRIEAGISYNFIKAYSDDTGDDPLDRLPHHRGDAWVQGRLDRRFSLLARVRYFGTSIDRMVDVPGYVLVEASATAQLSREYLAVLKIDDLVDEQPETRAGYHTAGRVIALVLQGQWE
jgi:outer membrane receptor protein involved in Fe transport